MSYDPKLPIKKTSTSVNPTPKGVTITTKFEAPTFETGNGTYLGQGAPNPNQSGYFGKVTGTTTQFIPRNKDGNVYADKKVVTSVTVDKKNNSQQAFPGSSTKPITDYIHDGRLTKPHN